MRTPDAPTYRPSARTVNAADEKRSVQLIDNLLA